MADNPPSLPVHASRSIWLRCFKRPADMLVATLAILIISPILILTAILIKTTSHGPVFFTQTRGGKDARPFKVIKFRTMRGDRKPDPKELVPLHHPEITPLGRFLRRSKIDELPQLFNVIKGDMSLVGPRPTLPDQVEAYDDFRRQRLLVRPGVTGLAQVNSSAAHSWDERILYDIAYVRKCRLWLDLTVIGRSVLVILLGESRTARPFLSSPYSHDVTPPPDFDVSRPEG
ncbi:MAG: sugar transferase [Phycisphaerae bacterium]|nr:sugar transferase [Phycisphaerae bacterium]